MSFLRPDYLPRLCEMISFSFVNFVEGVEEN